MKIIIAGAGEVGTHLAKMLSGEKQDIILMDTDEEKLGQLEDNFDLMTVNASSLSIAGLKEANVPNADLFIGVTPDESRNMTSCLLAHSLGAKKTVARIDNAEYLQPKHQEFFANIGINSLIYPEMLAAREIVDAIKMSWIRQWWEVDGGELVLIAVKLRRTAHILDIPLHQLDTRSTPFLIVAIKRGMHTIIPRGDDTLQELDLVYFMTMKKYIPYIRQIAGKDDYKDVRNVMIMGGSRIAVRTAQMAPEYMKVKIIEKDIERCHRLTELIDNDRVMIINGDGRDMDLLMDEGIENTRLPGCQTDGRQQDRSGSGEHGIHQHGRRHGHRHHHQQEDDCRQPHLPDDARRRRDQREVPHRGQCRRGRVHRQGRFQDYQAARQGLRTAQGHQHRRGHPPRHRRAGNR